MKEKVVVLRELQRAFIYTNELSKQVIEGHVSRAFTVYSVHEGARLTSETTVGDRHDSRNLPQNRVSGDNMAHL
jgi:hypothetical protein